MANDESKVCSVSRWKLNMSANFPTFYSLDTESCCNGAVHVSISYANEHVDISPSSC
jgi:hypothetical protein